MKKREAYSLRYDFERAITVPSVPLYYACIVVFNHGNMIVNIFIVAHRSHKRLHPSTLL